MQITTIMENIQLDLKKAMQREIEFRKDPEATLITSVLYIEDVIQIKDACRAIISQLPTIGCKKHNVTDEKIIPLIKKIIQEEKVRQVYQLKLITASDVEGKTSKQVDVMVKEIIADPSIDLLTFKIKYMIKLIPAMIDADEIHKFLNTIDFTKLKSPMMAIGLVKKEFGPDRVDGNMVKKIINERN